MKTVCLEIPEQIAASLKSQGAFRIGQMVVSGTSVKRKCADELRH